MSPDAKVRDFYARSPENQEGIICNFPLCCGKRYTDFVEHDLGNAEIVVEGRCPVCDKHFQVDLRYLN